MPTSPDALRHPTPRMLTDALHVATSPNQCHDQPALRAYAWAVLKAARGQRFNQIRISLMQDTLRPAQIGGAA